MRRIIAFTKAIPRTLLILVGVMGLALIAGNPKYFLAGPASSEPSPVSSAASEAGST
jgi:hypothetical protein